MNLDADSKTIRILAAELLKLAEENRAFVEQAGRDGARYQSFAGYEKETELERKAREARILANDYSGWGNEISRRLRGLVELAEQLDARTCQTCHLQIRARSRAQQIAEAIRTGAARQHEITELGAIIRSEAGR